MKCLYLIVFAMLFSIQSSLAQERDIYEMATKYERENPKKPTDVKKPINLDKFAIELQTKGGEYELLGKKIDEILVVEFKFPDNSKKHYFTILRGKEGSSRDRSKFYEGTSGAHREVKPIMYPEPMFPMTVTAKLYHVEGESSAMVAMGLIMDMTKSNSSPQEGIKEKVVNFEPIILTAEQMSEYDKIKFLANIQSDLSVNLDILLRPKS